MIKCEIKHKKRVTIATAVSLLTIGLGVLLVMVMTEPPLDEASELVTSDNQIKAQNETVGECCLNMIAIRREPQPTTLDWLTETTTK